MSSVLNKLAELFGFASVDNPSVSTLSTGGSHSNQGNPLSDAIKSKATPGVYDKSIRARFYGLVFDVPVMAQVKLSEREKGVVDRVSDNLRSKDFRENAVPRLPTVVPQLLSSLRHPNASTDELVEIIKRDPVIAAAVLKLVNSTYYNPSGSKIESFHQAVMMLGMLGMRMLLSRALMQPIIQNHASQFKNAGNVLWAHSSSCALACQILGKKTGVDPFKAYLAGLVHDMGTITLLTQLSQEFQKSLRKSEYSAESFVPCLESNAAVLSARIAKDWAFPDDVVRALQEQSDSDSPDKRSPIGKILHEANYLCEIYALQRHADLTQEEAADLLKSFGDVHGLFEQLDQNQMAP